MTCHEMTARFLTDVELMILLAILRVRRRGKGGGA
jgi:hypothetical protein